MNTKQNQKTPTTSGSRDGFLKNKGALIAIIAGGVVFLISIIALLAYFFLFPRTRSSERPLVLIHSPSAGDEVVIGETLLVHASGRDAQGITRMEFWVDGVLEEVETSSLDEGLNPFPMLVSWDPDREGEISLVFRAFNSRGARSQSSLTVIGVVGSDRDRDGIEDPADACPDLYGAGEDGCPLPGDGDGDGVPDGEDLCPDAPGEEDDLGCPDRDGDGVPDHLDADPDEAGPAELDGAPDTDGDSVPDDEDLRPEDPGDPEAGGAPESGAGDRDGDGAADDVDPCPDEAGEPEDGYCPPPEEDPVSDEEEPGGGDPGAVFEATLLEVEAYGFRVGEEYDEIWCYVQVGDLPMEQYVFQPEGDREWNIREVLAGANSVHVEVGVDPELGVSIHCLGDRTDDGLLHEIGEYEFQHPREDWNGRELVGVGVGTEGDSFVARYRICSPTCDETAVQPPVLHPITLGPRGEGPYEVRWNWEGDEDWLSGFFLALNGAIVAEIPPDWRSLDLADYVPHCGEVFAFQLYAIHTEPGVGGLEYSPPSNTQIWDGLTCPRTVLVSFVELDPSARGGRPGPIYGSFYANDVRLEAAYREGRSSFDATDDPEWYLDRIINIPLMFEQIESVAWSCIGNNCTSNYAPSTNSVEVELGPRETLTFGASIWTERDGRLFEGSESIPAGEIIPGEYQVQNNGIVLTVMIDVLVGPEAGGPNNLPDLVVTGVSREEESGQLRVQVFNNAADLIGQDIPVSIYRMSTGEELVNMTWEDVTIPSGSGATLMSSEVVLDSPYDLRIIVDPDPSLGSGLIQETNEDNNLYETPVLMRVHINSFRIGAPCESFLDATQTAEFRFRVWITHRSPSGEVTSVAERNHPWTGNLEWTWDVYPYMYLGEWDLDDNPWFDFEFEMPADHILTIHADGYEDDVGTTTDDYAGWISESYSREVNYGAQEAEYSVASQAWHECHDGTPLGWDTNNFSMQWIINRVH